MTTPALSLLAALITALGLASCANPSHLIVFQHSNLGVNAGVSPATNNFHVRVGLRREFAAVVPKYIDEGTDANANRVRAQRNEAASAFVAARMRVISPWHTPHISEILATGEAAVNIAKRNNGGSAANATPEFIGDTSQTIENNKAPDPVPAPGPPAESTPR